MKENKFSKKRKRILGWFPSLKILKQKTFLKNINFNEFFLKI
jgi:hypothetical protein